MKSVSGMANAIIAFSKSTVSVCVRKSCEKLEEIASMCCLTEKIIDDPQNLSYHYVKSQEFSENSIEINRYRSSYVSERQTLTIQIRLAQMHNKLTLLL